MFLVLILAVCLFYSFCHLVNVELRRRKFRKPPGPVELPLVGSVIQLIQTTGFSGQHFEKFHKICQKYGNTVFLKTGAMNIVVTEDFEHVKEVMTSADWSYRFPSHRRFREHTLFKNLGLMWSEADVHAEMRKFTAKALRAFGFGELNKAEVFLDDEISDLFQLIEQKRVSGEVFMHHIFKIPTFNVLWRVMAGERFEHGDHRIEALIEAVDDVSRINIGLDPEWAFPFLRFIPGCSPSRSKRPSFEICHNFFIDLMKERRSIGSYKDTQNDFIDYFLCKIDEELGNPGTMYTDEQYQVTCVDLLFGGLDTTANSLEFGILYMTKYPWIQRKVQAEIDAVVEDRVPSITDRPKLRYVEAVMLETLRCACIVPMNGRTANCDTTIGPYHVKKDTIAALNVTIVHNSKELWGDPEVFRPERFLDDSDNIINSDKVLAFGGGKRRCPGYVMAKVIWQAFFTRLLQRYDFRPSPAHPELSIIPDPGVANTPKPFYCLITPRHVRSSQLI